MGKLAQKGDTCTWSLAASSRAQAVGWLASPSGVRLGADPDVRLQDVHGTSLDHLNAMRDDEGRWTQAGWKACEKAGVDPMMLDWANQFVRDAFVHDGAQSSGLQRMLHDDPGGLYSLAHVQPRTTDVVLGRDLTTGHTTLTFAESGQNVVSKRFGSPVMTCRTTALVSVKPGSLTFDAYQRMGTERYVRSLARATSGRTLHVQATAHEGSLENLARKVENQLRRTHQPKTWWLKQCLGSSEMRLAATGGVVALGAFGLSAFKLLTQPSTALFVMPLVAGLLVLGIGSVVMGIGLSKIAGHKDAKLLRPSVLDVETLPRASLDHTTALCAQVRGVPSGDLAVRGHGREGQQGLVDDAANPAADPRVDDVETYATKRTCA